MAEEKKSNIIERIGKGEREIGNGKVMQRSTKTDMYNKKEQETEENVRKIWKRGKLMDESRENQKREKQLHTV